MMFLKPPYVVMNGSADLDNLSVGEQAAKPAVHSYILDSEEESLVRPGKLQQRHPIAGLALRETRTRLRIKADYGLRAEIGKRTVKFSANGINHVYLSGKRHVIKLFKFLCTYTFNIHNKQKIRGFR